jgi:hypothetical protein
MDKELNISLDKTLGELGKCSSCHHHMAIQKLPGKVTWRCSKNNWETTPDYSCADYVQYAGHRELHDRRRGKQA